MGTHIRYKGPLPEVEVPAIEEGFVVPRLKAIEIDTDTATRLLEQEDNWERPPAKKQDD
jgi:hypothetical protein